MTIKEILEQELCDKLVQSASLIIGHNVLITDENGCVLSSNDATRIGTTHGASVEVIRQGVKAYHDSKAAENLTGTRPGMTMPIYVEGEVVGTIGITGAPQEISHFAMLIQQMTEIFLNFHGQQQISTRKTLQKQGLLRKIITFDSGNYTSESVYTDAYELGYDLNLRRIAVFIELFPKERAKHSITEEVLLNSQMAEKLFGIFSNTQDFLCPQNNLEYVGFMCFHGEAGDFEEELREKCRQLGQELKQFGYSVRIGIGTLADSLDSLRQSYENACFAERILKKKIIQDNCLMSSDAVLEKLAVSIPDEICLETEMMFFNPVFRSKNMEELLETIVHWCRCRFNFVQTANALHIHKSTLVYRFQRIQERYGLDLYDFDKVTAIYLLAVRHKFFKNNI